MHQIIQSKSSQPYQSKDKKALKVCDELTKAK
jgi:hypothetical protein